MTIEDMLRTYDDDELRAELERREVARKQRKPQIRPLDDIDWEELHSYLDRTIDFVDKNNNASIKDVEHVVFEIAMSTVYDEDLWPWWNKKVDS